MAQTMRLLPINKPGITDDHANEALIYSKCDVQNIYTIFIGAASKRRFYRI